ncbi:MAG: hypothetical protein JW829_15615 [Pirellulales bacterium]|nr:hypothetical protein [Pirellulales bacterium]
MAFRRMLFVLLAPALGTILGCDDTTVKHDEIDKILIESNRVISTDPAKAVELLNRVIEAKPSEYAYYSRGWCYARMNEDEKAKADVSQGLKISPDHPGLKWLEGELKKPVGQRKLSVPIDKLH